VHKTGLGKGVVRLSLVKDDLEMLLR